MRNACEMFVHLTPTDNATIAYEDTTLAQFLTMEITIDEALNFVASMYGSIEPEMIFEVYGSYQDMYNEYLENVASLIVDEIQECGESCWYDQNISIVD